MPRGQNGSGKLREISRDGPDRIARDGAAVSAAALLILAAASTTPATATQCPAISGQTLVYIDIFDGPPENLADLVPDEHKTQSGKAWNTWQLEAGADGLFVKCGYGKKLEGPYSHMETVRLPDTVKTCRADFKTGKRPDDLILTHFSCL